MIILVPLYNIITNTTKWKQNGITIYRQFDLAQSRLNMNPMYIDDNQTIYIGELSNNRVIELKLNGTNVSVVAAGNDTHQLSSPFGIIVDKKSDSIFICEQARGISRWSRQNGGIGDLIIPEPFCKGLAMDDNGYLYVVHVIKNEFRRGDI